MSLERMDELYENSSETDRIIIGDVFVNFTKHFKYLGSYISYHMRDDYDIEKRIAAGSKAMGALSNYWNNDHVDMFFKYRIFMAIPVNLLLWGCESWALKESSLNRLDVFLHRSIRRIMKISMSQVKENRISNEKIREMFYHIPNLRELIAIRQCRFIGKVVRGPNCHPPKQILTAWCNNKRPTGAPIITNKKSIVKSLKILLPEEMGNNKYGDLRRWLEIATDKKLWDHKIAKLKNPNMDIPEPPSQNPNENNNQDSPPPSPPRQRRRRNNTTPPNPQNNEILEAYQILELERNVTGREVKIKFRQLSRIYHPDKHQPEKTGMSNDEAKELFQKFNNAQEILIEHLKTNQPTTVH